jgi:outer membrane immunogenic protein
LVTAWHHRFFFFKRMGTALHLPIPKRRELLKMHSNKLVRIAAILCGSALASVPMVAQQEYSKQEVSIQALGSFGKSTTSNGVEQTSTNSGGVLANYRYFFTNKSGVELNYAFSTNTQSYALGGGPLGVNTRSNEASAAYVFRMPLKHFTPFLLAGAGGLIFSPKNFSNDFGPANTQARAAFVYGGGADFNVGSHVFLRAQYRGLVYNSPTYDLTALNGADRITHRAEPSIGVGYRF